MTLSTTRSRARLSRGAVYRFSQGDFRALADQFDKVAGLYAVVTRKPLPPERLTSDRHPARPRGLQTRYQRKRCSGEQRNPLSCPL